MSQTSRLDDSYRDAMKYRQMLLAIEQATQQVRQIEQEGRPDIDQVMARLLPQLAGALDAELAFVATPTEIETTHFEITAAFPASTLQGHEINAPLLRDLVRDGRARVIDPLGNATMEPIEGLQTLGARAGVLVRMQIEPNVRIVGVCNKTTPGDDPFLASDHRMLANIVELVAIGLRVGDRHRRQLESIQATSAAINLELDLERLLPTLAEAAAKVFDSPATSLMLWNEQRRAMVIKAKYGVSTAYQRAQKIPADAVARALHVAGPGRPILIDDLQQTPLGDLDQIVAEDLRTVLAAPLLVQDDLIGCLNVYSRGRLRRFTQDECELAMIFANQASTAIHNARLYQETNRRNVHLSILLDASKTIASQSATSSKETLNRITKQAVERVAQATGPKATWGSILLYDPLFNELSFASRYSPGTAQTEHYERWVLDRKEAPNGKIGIVGRAVLEKRVQRVSDVRLDCDYIDYNLTTRSELAVPLISKDQVMGVLALESDEVGAFGEEDERVLTGLSELATIAVQNADQARRLSRMNALALMGAWEADIAHDINREVGAIRRSVYMLQRDPGLSTEAKQRLTEIDSAASGLALPEDPGSQHLTDRAVAWQDAARLDQVIREEAAKLQQRFPSLVFQLDLGCPLVRVRMRAQWLRRLTRHLVHNAAQAITQECEQRCVTIRTIRYETRAEVQVEDTGAGIDPAIRPLLFERPIDHGDGQSGRGLLLVRFVAEQHSGYARTVYSEPNQGSSFAFGIPLAKPEGDRS
jgi:GAF domain-containing protein